MKKKTQVCILAVLFSCHVALNTPLILEISFSPSKEDLGLALLHLGRIVHALEVVLSILQGA